MPLCYAVDDIGEMGFRVEAVEFCGLEDGVDDGGALTVDLRAEEQEIFTSGGDGAQGALGLVVVDIDTAVCGAETQALPAAERIAQCLDEATLRGEPGV
ncbi:hypothetical protein GT370_06380 [Acidocella sp. MX-AZ03]|nr:hypothetical protein [Acidocella sp. MX-AZ03]WBO60413.1 hypothetical protein GT370_06380 [Acidocella sp. MX-AZ03]